MKCPKNLFVVRSVLGMGVTLFLFASAASGQPGQLRPINRPAVITEPGSYILQRGFSLPAAGTAITILADNVTVDLNGESLVGPGGKQGIGISIEDVTGVRVHNGRLADFGTGVRVMNANNVRIENLQISGQDLGGTPPDIEIGVLLVNSRGVLVQDNVVSRVFLGIFVRGGGSGANRIAMNTLTGGANGALGICYNPSPVPGSNDGPSGDLVYNNLVSRFGRGIATSAQSVGNIFRGNDIAFFSDAINEATPGSNTFVNNTSVQIAP